MMTEKKTIQNPRFQARKPAFFGLKTLSPVMVKGNNGEDSYLFNDHPLHCDFSTNSCFENDHPVKRMRFANK